MAEASDDTSDATAVLAEASAKTWTEKLSIPRKIVKALAIAFGGAATTVCLMAVVGLLIHNIWVGLGLALVIAIALPALLADKLLPDGEDAPKPRGLISDVFALGWLAFAVLFAVAGRSFTHGMLARQGDRFVGAGYSLPAQATYLLAGVEVVELETPLAPAVGIGAAGSAAVDPSAQASASAQPSSTAAATASASASATAAASSSASAATPATKKALTPAELFERWAPSVVTIQVEARNGMVRAGGTGFLLDDRGTIATNSHVISVAEKGEIRFKDGASYKEIWVLAEDGVADIALLRVELDSPTTGEVPKVDPVELGNSDDIVVGEATTSIGNPLGLDHTLTTGVVSSRRKFGGRAWIQTSTPISPGNSGGPLFNARGEVIGITTASVGDRAGAQNLNLAVPINVLSAMLKPEYPSKHKLGQQGAKQW